MSDLLVLGKLVTLAGPPTPRIGAAMRDLAVIEDGAMLIHNGIIDWVGPREKALALPQAEVVEALGRVVTPGFVDAHAHPVFGGCRANEFSLRCEGRTYQEIAAAGGGILSSVRATRAATEDELVEAGRRHSRWMLAGGTTTIEAKSGYGLSVEDELKMLRAIRRLDAESPLTWVSTFLGAHAVPEEHRAHPAEYIRIVREEMLPSVAREGLAEYADAFYEERYFDRAACHSILGRAKELGLGIRLHADQLSLSGGAQLAAELGAKTADHLEQTNLDGIRSLKQAGVMPVLLPGSVYALGLQHYPNARAMIEEGLPVVLATDFNPGSSPVPSMPLVMSLACTQMRMTPEETITATTVNAAYSLDRGYDRGTLEAGKRADFVVWDCEDPREVPYWAGAPLVNRVYADGKMVYRAC